jgi:hypothetical protein
MAELARVTRDDRLVSSLAIACGDLACGFAAPEGSRERSRAHHRAWATVKDLERAVIAARINRLAPAKVITKAQRAIDRADVMLSTLPGVLPG